MSAKYAVTDMAHPALRDVREDCEECLELAKNAAIHARATGSKSSQYASGEHFALVRRTSHVITL